MCVPGLCILAIPQTRCSNPVGSGEALHIASTGGVAGTGEGWPCFGKSA